MTIIADSCRKHYFLRAFVYGLIDNDERVASSQNHTQFKTKMEKPYPYSRPKWPNQYPIYDQNCQCFLFQKNDTLSP